MLAYFWPEKHKFKLTWPYSLVAKFNRLIVLLKYIIPILYKILWIDCSIRVYQTALSDFLLEYIDLLGNIQKYWEGLPAILAF